MNLALIITAAGSSTRFGAGCKKEYLPLTISGNEGTVLSHCLDAFLKTSLFSYVVITIPQNHQENAKAALSKSCFYNELFTNTRFAFAFEAGGNSRQESVYCGLKKIEQMAAANNEMPDAVLIHDGARPWVDEEIINAVIEKLPLSGAAVTALPATDTQKEVDASGKITKHLHREQIFAVQTPQGFYLQPLLEAHKKAASDGCIYTDDTEIWGRYCGDVYICKGSTQNKKITYKEDL